MSCLILCVRDQLVDRGSLFSARWIASLVASWLCGTCPSCRGSDPSAARVDPDQADDAQLVRDRTRMCRRSGSRRPLGGRSLHDAPNRSMFAKSFSVTLGRRWSPAAQLVAGADREHRGVALALRHHVREGLPDRALVGDQDLGIASVNWPSRASTSLPGVEKVVVAHRGSFMKGSLLRCRAHRRHEPTRR